MATEMIAKTGERLLTLREALNLIKREEGREARSLIRRAYGCFCAREAAGTDALLKTSLESENIRLGLSTAKRDASIYEELASRKIVHEGLIVSEYESYLLMIGSSWSKLTYAFKIPAKDPSEPLILASIATKKDLVTVVGYNEDSTTVTKISASDCIRRDGETTIFVLPEPVQAWRQAKKEKKREISSGEIGAAFGIMLGAIEAGSEQALEALHILASRAGYRLVAVETEPEPELESEPEPVAVQQLSV
jgi:hypothetical protein